LYPPPQVAAKDRRAQPDWVAIHRELRRPGVTLALLWEEHRGVHPDGHGYSRYCELYRAWKGRLSPTMRQTHVAGERMFVNYASMTLELVDGTTGEIHVCQLFVAVLGASNFTSWKPPLRNVLSTGSARTSVPWNFSAVSRRRSFPTA
jgi:transposase